MNLNELFVKVSEVKNVDTRSEPRQDIEPAMVAGGRKPHLDYKEKMARGVLDRVTVELAGKDSEIMTKLSKKYKEIDDLNKRLTTLRDSFNTDAKEHVLDYFDAQDEVLTRVIETASLTLTLSKKTVRTDTEINFQEFYKELLTLLPELEDKLKILSANTQRYQVTKFHRHSELNFPGEAEPDENEIKNKAKSLKGTKKESVEVFEAQDSFWSRIAELGHHFLNSFKKWGKNYDRKLESLKHKMTEFTVGESTNGKILETRIGEVTFKIEPNGNLTFHAGPEAKEELEELLTSDTDWHTKWADFLEIFNANGMLNELQPEEIGALTDAPILTDEKSTDDHGNITHIGTIWWYPNYQVSDPLEELLKHGEVTFTKADTGEHSEIKKENVTEAKKSQDMNLLDMHMDVKELHKKSTAVFSDLLKLEMTALRVASGNEPGTDVEFEREMSNQFKTLSFEAEELADKIKKVEFHIEDRMNKQSGKKSPVPMPESTAKDQIVTNNNGLISNLINIMESIESKES